jgi:hypothetical protein
MRSPSAGPGAQIVAFETQARKLADLRVNHKRFAGQTGGLLKNREKNRHPTSNHSFVLVIWSFVIVTFAFANSTLRLRNPYAESRARV